MIPSSDDNVPGAEPLPMLEAGGFGASVDAYAWDPDPDPAAHRMRLWLLSLLGAQQAVKALWARLVKGEPAMLSRRTLGDVQFCALAPEGPRGWRFFTASLPGAAGYQGLLVPEAALFSSGRPDFLLLPRKAQEAPHLYARFLNRRLDLPLHPNWAGWLWERALGTGEAVPLEAHGLLAYRCAPDQERLAAALSAAVADGSLRVTDAVSHATGAAGPRVAGATDQGGESG